MRTVLLAAMLVAGTASAAEPDRPSFPGAAGGRIVR
jgi:hypothetical protein